MVYLKYIIILFYLISCSYTPIAKYKQNIIKNKIYTEIDISISEPKNSVLLKDALNDIMFRYFNNSTLEQNSTFNFIKVTYKSINFRPTSYDKNGYTLSYRAEIELNFKSTINNDKIEKDINGNYDFFISSDQLLSNDIKYKAIKYSSEDALNKFINFYLLN